MASMVFRPAILGKGPYRHSIAHVDPWAGLRGSSWQDAWQTAGSGQVQSL